MSRYYGSRRALLKPGGSGLFNFTSFSFSSVGSGYAATWSGGTLSQILSNYDTPTYSWLNNLSYYNVYGGVQYWTVPATGTYTITAAGGSGGSCLISGEAGGNGAIVSGTANLSQGQVLRIIAGTRGGRYSYTAGGGGASSVHILNAIPVSIDNVSSLTPLLIAGAGGGGGNSGGTGQGAVTTNGGNGGNASGGSGGTGGGGGGGGGGWGVGGAGLSGIGSGNTNPGAHGSWDGANNNAMLNGTNGSPVGSNPTHGIGYTSNLFDYDSGSCVGAPGGFGGGGGGQCNGGGGGAGYSGGAAGGGAGSCYWDTSRFLNGSATSTNGALANGYVSIVRA